MLLDWEKLPGAQEVADATQEPRCSFEAAGRAEDMRALDLSSIGITMDRVQNELMLLLP